MRGFGAYLKAEQRGCDGLDVWGGEGKAGADLCPT